MSQRGERGRGEVYRFAGIGAAATAVLLAGPIACATRGDVEDLMAEHQQIRQRQDELQARMDQLTRNLTELLRGIRADFQADLGQVIQQMNAVEAALRGTETRIEQLRRVQPPPPQPIPTAEDSLPLSIDPIGLYNGAITDYQQNRLDLSRQGFSEYLRLFPNGPSASDAQYWLGIIDYDQGQYSEAITQLRRVPDRYPDSSKAPLALRKIGDAYRAMGDGANARRAYRELIDSYPNSSEAQAARRELES